MVVIGENTEPAAIEVETKGKLCLVHGHLNIILTVYISAVNLRTITKLGQEAEESSS